jgi:hypothetical protein
LVKFFFRIQQSEPEESPGKRSVEEELSHVRGAAREQRRLFEQGGFEHTTKKTIDDEDMSFAHGSTAMDQKRLIEQGHYESKVKKYLDEEEFPDTMTGRMVEVDREEEEQSRYVSSEAKPGEIPSKYVYLFSIEYFAICFKSSERRQESDRYGLAGVWTSMTIGQRPCARFFRLQAGEPRRSCAVFNTDTSVLSAAFRRFLGKTKGKTELFSKHTEQKLN